MSQGPIQWRQSLKAHYPTITDFGDATTIRHMLAMSQEWVRDYDLDLGSITDEPTREYWVALFKEDHEAFTALIAELQDWLKAKGLEL